MHWYVSRTSVITRLTWCGGVRCERFNTKELFIITRLAESITNHIRTYRQTLPSETQKSQPLHYWHSQTSATVTFRKVQSILGILRKSESSMHTVTYACSTCKAVQLATGQTLSGLVRIQPGKRSGEYIYNNNVCGCRFESLTHQKKWKKPCGRASSDFQNNSSLAFRARWTIKKRRKCYRGNKERLGCRGAV
jgi:hypothetical protein